MFMGAWLETFKCVRLSAARLARSGQGWMVPQGLYYSFVELDLMGLRRYKGVGMVILSQNPFGLIPGSNGK